MLSLVQYGGKNLYIGQVPQSGLTLRLDGNIAVDARSMRCCLS